MLGTHNQEIETNPTQYQDIAEYATMAMLSQTMADLKQQGVKVTASTMQSFRDSWQRDGQPMDFATVRPKVSDFVALLRSTGATSFGRLDDGQSLEEGIQQAWVKARSDYKAQAAKGIYLHAVTDPVLRGHIFEQNNSFMTKAVFSHKGRSARELNPGETVQFHDKTGQAVVYQGNIGTVTPSAPVTSPTQSRSPFSARNVAEVINEPTEESVVSDEKFLGWHGGTFQDREYRGLKHVLGAYLTNADADQVSKTFDDDILIDANLAYNSLELLQHMRSNGYDFSVRDNGLRNQIEVALNAGENTKVRVFDNEANGTYIGRVYDAYNAYYYNVMGSKSVKDNTTFTPEDSIALLDYVTGHRQGKITKSVSSVTSRVEVAGIQRQKSLQVVPIAGRYRALSYESPEEAREYIETGINEAKAFVNGVFQAAEIQAVIDDGLDDPDVMVTSEEFRARLEPLYSSDVIIREAQERAVKDFYHSEDGGLAHLETIRDEIVGDYENGFNPSVVVDHMRQTGRGNERDAMMAALKVVGYDVNKIKGNEFAVNTMKERLIAFDPETARGLDDVTHPIHKQALKTVQDTLVAGQFAGIDPNDRKSKPEVMIDENGVIRWEANRKTGSRKPELMWQRVSGEIGQVMVPDEHGIIKTQFQGQNNYGLVPGYTGYFSFEGDYSDRMSRFRVKGFEQHLAEQLQAKVQHQMTRPYDEALGNIATTLDASGLNGLYHGDVYGKRIDMDFMDANQLSDEAKQAIVTTLANRVRFDNQFSDYATTSAETQANRDFGQTDDESAFSYWKTAGETNMRVLNEDIENYADLTMTGTGKTQGLIWYLTDGSKVNKDGTVTPSKGMMDKDGNTVPDKTALKKLDYFQNEQFNAWDRTQMSANQLMTALKVDEGVNTALMAFGGWTFDDSYAVSKEFAERNLVQGKDPNEESQKVLNETLRHLKQGTASSKHEVLNGTGMMWSDEVLNEGLSLIDDAMSDDKAVRKAGREAFQEYLDTHGTFRPLQRGDKVSDFGGNKGTIGIVIDRDMDPEEAKKQGLDKEVRFMKANPELDVISAPYSMLSRHNAGVVKELMSGEPKDLVDPDTGEVYEAAMGKLNIIVTDMVVDDKTHAYTAEDVLDGKGRKASGQLAWALQSKGADNIMNEIYGHNDSAWSTYREYLIATGLDMKPDGTIQEGYTPHHEEERTVFAFDPSQTGEDFLDQIRDQGGFLELPFELDFKTGKSTNELPVLSASLRQNVELIDGTMRRSDFTNHYANIYESIGDYVTAETDQDKEAAQARAQDQFDKIQATIIDRQFDGGHNGKHSFIRDKIMGKRMNNSATGVAVVDPRLEIGQAGMNQEMMDALNAKEGDIVMAFRDPVWRDGAIRAMTVVKDDSVHGIAINPIADKSHDMDFDGDTMGIMKFDTPQANRDLVEKFSHWSNMIDKGSGKGELYFQTGMDLASAQAKADQLGDSTPRELYEKVEKNAMSTNPKILKQAQRDLTKYSHKLFREHSFGADYVSLKDDAAVFNSFQRMVDNKAKGSAGKLQVYKDYHEGKKTAHDARDIQYATGVKSDDTGLAGAFSQKLVSVMRNDNISAALEAMYPLTQGTLQIKHDADHARTVNDILTDDMNKIFRGKDVNNPKRSLTPHTFKVQLSKTLHEKMMVDVGEDHIEAVTETLTHNGKLIPLGEAMTIKGSPMDRVAYGGGYEELKNLAKNNESLLTGEQNKLFAPFKMRNATEETVIAKKDTQRIIERVEPEAEAVAVAAVAVEEYDEGLAL